MKQNFILTIQNNTTGQVPVTILSAFDNNNIINARTRYAWNITGLSYSTSTFSIQAKSNAAQAFVSYSGFASDAASLVTALNNLGVGVFWTEVSGPNTYLVTWNDNVIYQNLVVGSAGSGGFVFSINSVATLEDLVLIGTGIIDATVDWGDASVVNYSGASPLDLTHNYGVAGLFGGFVTMNSDANNISELKLQFNNIASIGNLGNFPNMQILTIQNNEITSINISSNPLLTSFNAGNNFLSTAQVNAALIALDGFGLLNGNFDTAGQTPAAPPSGAGAAAKLSLQGKGWTVTTD